MREPNELPSGDGTGTLLDHLWDVARAAQFRARAAERVIADFQEGAPASRRHRYLLDELEDAEINLDDALEALWARAGNRLCS